jgi:hypothetical protein
MDSDLLRVLVAHPLLIQSHTLWNYHRPNYHCGSHHNCTYHHPTSIRPTIASYGAWVSKGCYVDSVAQRALPIGMAVTGGAAAITVPRCLEAFHVANYAFGGVEYAQQCYCGSSRPLLPLRIQV